MNSSGGIPMDLVAQLAQEIRRVDGDHTLGAEALAEALAPFVESALSAGAEPACQTCNGVGMIGGTSGQTPENFQQDSEPCPDCTRPQPATPASGWMPIESAPRDGTDIILLAHAQTRAVKPRVTIGHWATEEECRMQVGDCGGPCRCPEYEYDDPSWLSWDGGFSAVNPPILWQPLPPPPASTETDKQTATGDQP